VGSAAGPAIYESPAGAQGIVSARHVGHFQIDSYGYPGNRGCYYIIDTVDGQLWHGEANGKPQLIGSVGKN
jgi:hypothetical protein